MTLASLKSLYFDELGDLYEAETQMIRTLPRLAEAARARELRDALKKHGDESRLHLERLQLIFTHWGEQPRPRVCAGLMGIVQEADDRLHQAATDDVRDAAIIGGARRMEHYEMAAYGCACSYARRLNRLDEARLLQETLDEEGQTNHHLSDLADGQIKDDARSDADRHAPPPVDRQDGRRERRPKEARGVGNEFVPVSGEDAEPERERVVAREFEPPAPSDRP